MRDPVANPRAIFTPGSPVSTDSLFYGRQGQLRRVLDAVPAAGRHPLIFGLRGVGKTSLANVLRYFLPDHTVSRLACVEGDTFKTIWRRALRQVRLVYDEPRIGFATPPAERTGTLHDFLPGDNGIGAADVAEAVGEFGAHPLVFILDEFDRVTDQAAKSATADLVKSLSDSNPHVTLVLVGVGQSIRDLIGEHPSIERNLVQVEMPKMTSEEIVGLVERGLARLSISTTPGVLAEVAELADGFPYYAHLLGLSMAMTAQQMGNGAVSEELFRDVVCPMAVEDSIDSYRQAYANASNTANASRHPLVLCACAFAACNDHGRFKTGDVADAMARVFGEAVNPHSIKRVLGYFASTGRGEVLVRHPHGSVNFYQFREPMMRPFLRIKAKSLRSGQ